MSYREVMEMPLRAFWSFQGQVNRLRAEEDLRAIQVTAAGQSGEVYKEVSETLRTEHGTPAVVLDSRPDPNATAKLKAALSG